MILTGVYMSTLKRNEYSGNTIFKFKYYNEKKEKNIMICHAKMTIYSKDMPLELEGELENNIFEVSNIKEKISDKDISIEYLSNKKINGLGKQKAKLLVDKYGPDIFSLVQEPDAVEKISSIKGITCEMAEDLIVSIRNTIEQRLVFEFIAKYDGSLVTATKITDKYGYNSLNVLKQNVYIVGNEVNLSFYTCDAIAKSLDYNYLDERRIQAIIREAMYIGTSQGHIYLTQKELYKNIEYVIKNSAQVQQIPAAYISTILIKCKWIQIEKDESKYSPARIFFKNLWIAENEVVRNIIRLNLSKNKLNFNDEIINDIEKECSIEYHDSQKLAFDVLKTTGIKIITGGPGTGKTTTINGIISAYKTLNPHKKVVLCAPTGRAAQKMKESTGHEAFTIHKLLDYKPFEKTFSVKNNTDPINADFIIVDEFSMIDIEIMSLFLNAVKDNTLILFVGDVNQLPSVGPGNVMRDIIASKKVDTYKLSMIFRQENDSPIVYNANQINNGKTLLKQNDDFEIHRFVTTDEMMEKLSEIVLNITDEELSQTQILSSIKKYKGGTFTTNKLVQDLKNPDNTEISFYNNTFKVNDKIIMTVNNYTNGYFNGDIGEIIDITKNGMELLINGNIIFLPQKNFDEISLAYSISIHKSQGSEFKNVIIMLPSEPMNMLQRNLIYTAITRAKEKVIILTQNDALEISIKKNSTIKRNTRLKQRLLDEKYVIVPINS